MTRVLDVLAALGAALAGGMDLAALAAALATLDAHRSQLQPLEVL